MSDMVGMYNSRPLFVVWLKDSYSHEKCQEHVEKSIFHSFQWYAKLLLYRITFLVSKPSPAQGALIFLHEDIMSYVFVLLSVIMTKFAYAFVVVSGSIPSFLRMYFHNDSSVK